MKRILAALAALCLLVPAVGWKKHECCMHCGCQCCPVKVCRVVCEVKKVPKTCYGCECEDICVPGPSCLAGAHCECQPDPCNPCCKVKKTVLDWIPGCAYVKTRAKLTKREVEVEQKTYKWVVEELCPVCAQACRADCADLPDDLPPSPDQPPAEPPQAPPAPENPKTARTGFGQQLIIPAGTLGR